jgi:superfamily I DNA and RNA helicase
MLTLSSGNVYYTQQELNDAKTKINNLVHQLREDFDVIREALLKEATNRDWCDAYNEFVDEVNSRTKDLQLHYMKKEYEVKVKLEETREQYVYITVEASSESEAEELVDEWDYSSLVDHAEEWEWNQTDSDFNTIRATLK